MQLPGAAAEQAGQHGQGPRRQQGSLAPPCSILSLTQARDPSEPECPEGSLFSKRSCCSTKPSQFLLLFLLVWVLYVKSGIPQAIAFFSFLPCFTQARLTDLGQLGGKLQLGNNPDSLV